MTTIKIATRKSPLALWQANFIKDQLHHIHPSLTIELIPLSTTGDEILDKPLKAIGGKALFVKTLQHALITRKADIAVHSMKDLSVHETPGLSIPAIYQRDDPRDALVSIKFNTLENLPLNAKVGTASPRRTALLKSIRPDLKIHPLRGNVGTRLASLDDHTFDAIILAAAGLQRLGLGNRIKDFLETETFIPAIAQGALCIECRSDDEEMEALISPLNHSITATCVAAERAVNQVLGGDCHSPIAAHAKLENNTLSLSAMVAHEDGSKMIRAKMHYNNANPKALGEAVAASLIDQGAKIILSSQSPT